MTVYATAYNIELRDKNGTLKRYLTPFVSSVSWEWNRIGGCGRCQIIIKKEYRSLEFDALDDIQIRIKSGAGTKLVYRGYIENISPVLQTNQQITLDVHGYFDLLKKRMVQDSGNTKIYASMQISSIVDSIIDTFVTVNSSITKGTIDASAFTVDQMEFRCSVDEALRTLAELIGDVEYGVNENLQFFWRTEDDNLRHKFFIGNNVEVFERKINWSKLVNKYYLQGGKVSGQPFLKTGEATDSQNTYFLAESIISNASIITATVADQYLGALLKQNSIPVLNIRAKIPNTDLRLEDTIPIGAIAFFDADYDQSDHIIGEAADGGSDLTVGLTSDGGSGAVIGGTYSAQIDRISYKMSETEARYNIEITLGDTILETAAKIKQLELELSSLRQQQ